MATAATKLASQIGPNFRIGGKQVFLPTALVTLVPKEKDVNYDPNLATFQVPLTFNKLDLRDYLYHCYNVEVRSVRSYIHQPKIQTVLTGRNNTFKRSRTFRPASSKFMIVELVKPFMPPSKPQDLSPWEVENYEVKKMETDSIQEYAKSLAQGYGTGPTALPVTGSRILQAQQARALRNGGAKWDNNQKLDEKWREVEVGWEAAHEKKP